MRNKNGQIVVEVFEKGTTVSTHNQPHRAARYICIHCDHRYLSATCERKGRKCPRCQNGAAGGELIKNKEV